MVVDFSNYKFICVLQKISFVNDFTKLIEIQTLFH